MPKNKCFFEHILFDCSYCAQICRKKGYNANICKNNDQLKAVCHCCNDENVEPITISLITEPNNITTKPTIVMPTQTQLTYL